MKHENTLKSLAERSPEMVEMETARPAQASPKATPSGDEQPQETQPPIPVPEYSGFAGYRHWGLNE